MSCCSPTKFGLICIQICSALPKKMSFCWEVCLSKNNSVPVWIRLLTLKLPLPPRRHSKTCCLCSKRSLGSTLEWKGMYQLRHRCQSLNLFLFFFPFYWLESVTSKKYCFTQRDSKLWAEKTHLRVQVSSLKRKLKDKIYTGSDQWCNSLPKRSRYAWRHKGWEALSQCVFPVIFTTPINIGNGPVKVEHVLSLLDFRARTLTSTIAVACCIYCDI